MESPAAGSSPADAQPKSVGSVKAVTISYSPEAEKLVADNTKFNSESLRSTVERVLAAQGLIKSDTGYSLNIELTSFRVRSSFTAVMFGFMAGSDNVEGVVTIKDAAGAVVRRAKVNASYALGGIGGGQDQARLDWLYEAFAKHTANEVKGQSEK